MPKTKMKENSRNKIILISSFAIAMAFVETAVVIYLRQIYYPSGFAFPLAGFILPKVLSIEWMREIATIIMLASVAFLTGRNLTEKFAYFLYSFAVWDIFYYIWLKISIGWPVSILTWDLLFLVPLPWISPVLAPIICSINMIVFASLIIHFENQKKKAIILTREWIILSLGVALIFWTFIYDYAYLIINGGFIKIFLTLGENQDFINAINIFMPVHYNWPVFFLGEALILIGIISFYLRLRK